jgi:hypothetical protein
MIFMDPCITEVVRGKSTNKRVKFAQGNVDIALKEQRVIQTLTTDVIYLKKQAFLITVASPLELTISSPLNSLTRNNMGESLQVHIILLRSRGTNLLIADPQKSLMSLAGSFLEISPCSQSRCKDQKIEGECQEYPVGINLFPSKEQSQGPC